MTQELHGQGGALMTAEDAAIYNTFAAYGEAAGGSFLPILKFSKGDFLFGQDQQAIPAGTELVFDVINAKIGWTLWYDGRPQETIMGYIRENFAPPKRDTLGHLDQSQWELDKDGKPQDPWVFSNQVPVTFTDNGEQANFQTSSKGGIRSLGKMFGDFAKQGRLMAGHLPIVQLGVESYQHKEKRYGIIKNPTFTIVQWISQADLEALQANAPTADAPEEAVQEPEPAPPPAAARKPAPALPPARQNVVAPRGASAPPVPQTVAPPAAASRAPSRGAPRF